MSELKENIDYYIDISGLLVFTEKYLLDRGYCCNNGCRHCPYKSNENNNSELIKPNSLHRPNTGNDNGRNK
ncbi:MAG: hypothetical protein IPG60_06320 [Bacteroidetes bacterium]|nr:hypothetical protein [Bacteroidota bacterium]MBP7399941.1 hypothetical protein [Chitinophagales bacterium]MBK7110347.1 hypothetical protein [Bacteroidota bacterium]MBK8488368.1 hypothetical protein [Bacteroidota bacterium]MBK8681868.1 hypothetical protein [Bacteroidota bacterium]